LKGQRKAKFRRSEKKRDLKAGNRIWKREETSWRNKRESKLVGVTWRGDAKKNENSNPTEDKEEAFFEGNFTQRKKEIRKKSGK